MRIKIGHFWLIFGVFGMLTFVGCGGGSGSSGVSGGTGFATIQGSVPGTVFVAVDDDTNLEVGRVAATGTWSPSDMTGDWVMHAVSSGDPGSRDWTYGHSVIDGSGNDTFSQMMGSFGPVSSTQMTFQMNDGVMTVSGMGGGMGGGMMGGGMMTQTFHGIMNGGKNIMVSTYTDESGGYPFSIQVK